MLNLFVLFLFTGDVPDTIADARLVSLDMVWERFIAMLSLPVSAEPRACYSSLTKVDYRAFRICLDVTAYT